MTDRLCPGCNLIKDASEFYARHTRCKACVIARVRRRRLTNPAVRAYDRDRAKTPARVAKATEITKKWRSEHPDAYRAQNAVNNAIRDGKIEKGPCEICGTTAHVHGHHKDYSRPLDVTWLCARCHHRLHAVFPELGGHFEGTRP